MSGLIVGRTAYDLVTNAAATLGVLVLLAVARQRGRRRACIEFRRCLVAVAVATATDLLSEPLPQHGGLHLVLTGVGFAAYLAAAGLLLLGLVDLLPRPPRWRRRRRRARPGRWPASGPAR